MSKTLIAVGGTGQEIALSCLRLAHMAGLEPPFVIVLDADQGRGRPTEFRTRTEELQHIESALKAAHGGRGFLALIKPLAENLRGRNLSDLASLFGSAGQLPSKVDEVLSVLFSPQQQRTNILDGFHGQPTVGAVAVHDHMIRVDSNTGDDLFALLDERTKARTEHFVVLAGSTTGGTGPGTIPPISRAILSWRQNLNPKRQIEVSGLVQLQWFHPEEDKEVDWSQTPDIDMVRLQRNSACLVRQYHSELDKLFDRMVLVGLPEVVRRCSAGPNQQPETLHWLNVLSGWVANELLYTGSTMTQLRRGCLFAYALDESESVLDGLHFERDGKSISIGEALDATRVMAAFGRGLGSQLRGKRPDIAMPKETYSTTRRVYDHDDGGAQGIQRFIERVGTLTQGDEEIVDWFHEACASRLRRGDSRSPRDPNDLKGAFIVNRNRTETDIRSVGGLLRPRRRTEQDFVASLLSKARTKATSPNPETLAVEIYRAVREQLLTGRALAQP